MKRLGDPRPPGRPAFVWALWTGDELPGNVDDTEVLLSARGPDELFAQVEIAGSLRTAVLAPEGDDDARKLFGVLGGTAARIALLLSSSRQPAEHGRHRYRVGISLFTYERGGDVGELSISLDDAVLKKVGEMAGHTAAGQPATWLRRHLQLARLPGEPPLAPERLIVSAGPGGAAEGDGFRLHGYGLCADVYVNNGVHRLRRVMAATSRDAKGPMTLIRGHLRLIDASQAATLRAEMRQQLRRLSAGEGFLAMWHEYNRLDSRFIHRQVRDFGYARYRSVHRLADGVVRLVIDAESATAEGGLRWVERVAQALGHGTPLELEASASLPGLLLAEDTEDTGNSWRLVDEEMPALNARGAVTGADTREGTVDLRLQNLGRSTATGIGPAQTVNLPANGMLFLSFRGDRRQLIRRKEAFDRISRRGTAIPNLLTLLEGGMVDAPLTRPPLRGVSDAAREIFGRGDGPTDRQEEAIEIALNTPDVAIIQGPPGTGKTQVITALQARLAEEGKSYADLRGSILLSSFQHAAVDELAERSKVFGLPANRVDRAGRGTTVQADQWRNEAIGRLRNTLGAPGRKLAALRRVAALSAGYLVTPLDARGTSALLSEIAELTEGLLPVLLADRLRERLDALKRTSAATAPATTDEDELAARALRGVRVTAEAFADDGPGAAGKALRRLRALPEPQPAQPAGTGRDAPAEGDLATLEQASAWAKDGSPPWLAELSAARDRLLDHVLRPSGPAPTPVSDPGVAELLDEVNAELEDAVRVSPDEGPDLALVEYLEALEDDPEAVAWTLRAYTASYAATCQQASSPAMTAAKQQTRPTDVVFDTVIIDEAARANPLDLMIPLIHAGTRIVLVGDQNQLPHMLEPDIERAMGDHGLLRESLFERLFTRLGRPDAPVKRVVTLDTQFRMHRELGDFVSRNFYRGTLSSQVPDEYFAHALPGYTPAVAAWLDVPHAAGREYGTRSRRRPAEAKVIAAELDRLLPVEPDRTFGVISFYADQVAEIWKELIARGLATHTAGGYTAAEHLQHDSRGNRLNRLRVGTVDAFQGNEFDFVLLSVTRSGSARSAPPPNTPEYRRWVAGRYGHLVLRNRLCVAMSRQKRLLVAVGDQAMFEEGPAETAPLTDFLRLCRKGAPYGRVLSA